MQKRNLTYSRAQHIAEYVYVESEYRAKNQKVFEKSHRK